MFRVQGETRGSPPSPFEGGSASIWERLSVIVGSRVRSTGAHLGTMGKVGKVPVVMVTRE